MLAQRLNARTVLDSERDVGTQTSLSFETSSSIRNEIAAYMEEERMLQEDSKDALDDDDDASLRGRNQYESLSLAELEMVHLAHQFDPNYDSSLLVREAATLARWRDNNVQPSAYPLDYMSNTEGPTTDGGDVWSEWGFDEGEEDSVYAEVRAAVSNTDDPTMPVNTLRMWLLGLAGSVLLAGVNQFFYYRYPSLTVSSLVIQLVTFPMGLFLARILPEGHWFINPGPFNIKEHTMITIMSGVAMNTAYATNIITVQRYFYNQIWSYSYQIMLVLSTQLIGFSMGGLLRQFLVWPAQMIWPASLVSTALLNTLHSMSGGGGSTTGGMSRDRFFFRVTLAMFIWSWVPSYLFTALSMFDFVTWIAPTNVVLNQVFGFQSGLGLSFITFDWGIVSTIGNPLAMPWWSAANMAVGFALVCVLYSATYYSGAFDSWYLPFSGSASYDNMGQTYNFSRILTEDATLNVTAYEQYSEIHLTVTYSIGYALSFACLTATFVHAVLYYRGVIWTQARRELRDETDIHARLMRRYQEVPQWWYASCFIVNLALALGAVIGWETKMPVWTLFLSLFIAAFFALPIGILQAITNQQVGLNVISELVIGYIAPGHPVAMMIFKTYSYITLTQGLTVLNDMKLGHYMKVPPRIMFTGQVVAAIVASFVQVSVGQWMFDHIPNMCTRKSQNFWCPPAETFGYASVIWGLIGPGRQFSPGRLYAPCMLGFLAGAIAPIPFYILARRQPAKWYKFFNAPMIFSATALVPPYAPINISSFCYTNFISQFVVRRYAFAWWSRYNYILSAALSAGYALAIIVIFFTLSFPKNGTIGLNTIQSWIGNTIYNDTADALGTPYKLLAPGEKFGASSWS